MNGFFLKGQFTQKINCVSSRVSFGSVIGNSKLELQTVVKQTQMCAEAVD